MEPSGMRIPGDASSQYEYMSPIGECLFSCPAPTVCTRAAMPACRWLPGALRSCPAAAVPLRPVVPVPAKPSHLVLLDSFPPPSRPRSRQSHVLVVDFRRTSPNANSNANAPPSTTSSTSTLTPLPSPSTRWHMSISQRHLFPFNPSPRGGECVLSMYSVLGCTTRASASHLNASHRHHHFAGSIPHSLAFWLCRLPPAKHIASPLHRPLHSPKLGLG
ncbi:hypothetical protein B0J13DRAFT_90102 [Dactylonectria estremocensis]|uniref:Uncharacterized protein n=1 Tax=Dactylonectria estremocensis TaxID=1079267 RepID=A0A9P9EC45_9HYPO|nr:hypothetical protein B0J13DRAFT_90102 [Dactylonectria estremocensis]